MSRKQDAPAAGSAADFVQAVAACYATLCADLAGPTGDPVAAQAGARQYLLRRLVQRFSAAAGGAADAALRDAGAGEPDTARPGGTLAESHRAAIAAGLAAYALAPDELARPGAPDALTPAVLEAVYTRLAADPGAAGVVYTARAEIGLMVRLALWDHLTRRLGPAQQARLDAVIFAQEPAAQAVADAAAAAAGLWPALDAGLRAVRACDPACGCGAFLLGLLALLDDLQARADRQVGRVEPPAARRARIVATQLRGVDVQAGACQVAAWRLALAVRAAGGSPPAMPPILGTVIRCGDSFRLGAGEWGGHDLVIGNPPYVRQEQIADPLPCPADGATLAGRRGYKAALARTVYQAFPAFFGYDTARDRAARPLDAKSDLYVYFYFLGLALLRPGGTLCFITSNAWLDVGYGAMLQTFLLQSGALRLVIDSQAARSFAADVNTVIVLAGRVARGAWRVARGAGHETLDAELAKDGRWTMDDGHADPPPARFVLFSVPYAQITRPGIFPALAAVPARTTTPLYRVHPIPPAALLAAGLDEAGRYAGGRWGGLYLRGPDIYWTVLAQGAGRLARLGAVAEVRFGCKSGANPFFYLDAARIAVWGIEPEYLQPFLFSLKEVTHYAVDAGRLARRLFVCRVPPEELAARGHHGALAYIRWGEAQGYHRRPSVRGRALWYALPEQARAHFVSNRFLGARFGFPWLGGLPAGDVFFVGRFAGDDGVVGTALLNSTLSFLSAEVQARQTYGIGVAYLYGPEIRGVHLLDPAGLDADQRTQLTQLFATLRTRPLRPLAAELTDPTRQALDTLVFDALALTPGERAGVHETLAALVAARLAKGRT